MSKYTASMTRANFESPKDYIRHKQESSERMNEVFDFIESENINKQAFLEACGLLDNVKSKTIIFHFYKICKDRMVYSWSARSQILYDVMRKMKSGEMPKPKSSRRVKSGKIHIKKSR
jgi:hypothetical protein